jgi:hypothetical protein
VTLQLVPAIRSCIRLWLASHFDGKPGIGLVSAGSLLLSEHTPLSGAVPPAALERGVCPFEHRQPSQSQRIPINTDAFPFRSTGEQFPWTSIESRWTATS